MSSQSQLVPIVLNLIAAIFGALGQYAYKLGASRLSSVSLLKNYSLFIGVFLFCFVMVLFVIAFKLGGKLSVVYPVYATTFIWGAAIAIFIEKEPFSGLQIFGIATIVIGVSLVAIGAPQG